MDVQEAKAMLGVEYIYHYEDGDTVRCYVKAFDPEIGLTCQTLDTETGLGWRNDTVEEDGTWCVMALDFRVKSSLGDALERLEQIKSGHFTAPGSGRGFGSPVCSF